jgi:hypothetical protein
LQVSIAAGQVTYTTETPLVPGPPPVSESTFGAGLPAMMVSQQTIQQSQPCTLVLGSPVLTMGGNRYYLLGRSVTGPGIPPGSFVIATTSTTLTLNNPVTSAGEYTLMFTVPKLEIRGDGYARISELERVILTSAWDATFDPGNTPALRIGNINGSHLRVDGGEILSMSSDSARGRLGLQGRFFRDWNWGYVNVTLDGSGEGVIEHGMASAPDFAVVNGFNHTNYRHIEPINFNNNHIRVKVRNNADAAVTTNVDVLWFAIATA